MKHSSKRHASSQMSDEKEQHSAVSILAAAAASVGTDSDTDSSTTETANDAAIAAAANELDFGYEFGAADPHMIRTIQIRIGSPCLRLNAARPTPNTRPLSR